MLQADQALLQNLRQVRPPVKHSQYLQENTRFYFGNLHLLAEENTLKMILIQP
jgi:hypothetical protein